MDEPHENLANIHKAREGCRIHEEEGQVIFREVYLAWSHTDVEKALFGIAVYLAAIVIHDYKANYSK